jgi:hypothetical protein
MQETDLTRRLATLPERVNRDAALVHRGRFVSLEMKLALGGLPFAVTFERGRIAALERGPFLLRSFRFAIGGGEAAWRAFWQPMPPPHHHDIFALQKRGLFTIEGDLYPLMANLLYFKEVLAAPREARDGAAA